MNDYGELLNKLEFLIRKLGNIIRLMDSLVDVHIGYDTFVNELKPEIEAVIEPAYYVGNSFSSLAKTTRKKEWAWYFAAATMTINGLFSIFDFLRPLISEVEYLKCVPEDIKKSLFNDISNKLSFYLDCIFEIRSTIKDLTRINGGVYV